jgi:hypothetical protein
LGLVIGAASVLIAAILLIVYLQRPTYNAEQWRVLEIPLTSAIDYANPFLDVDVTATFTAPDGSVITRLAFWDGGKLWKVRFAPTETGRWSFKISSSDPTNSGFNQAGTVQANAYTGNLPIYQHGFLKKSANGRYLTYADGTPFFWLGDTHWFFDDKERWDTANKTGWTSQFIGMVDKRVKQKFTVYQTAIFGPSGKYWDHGDVGNKIAPKYFDNNLDEKMQYIADNGLVNALALGFHGNIDGNVIVETRLAKYMVARYGALPMVWITAGEVAGYDKSLRQSRIDGWRQVALEINQDDGYNQLQSAHYTNDAPTYYQGEPWFDFTMLQDGHTQFAPTTRFLTYYNNYPTTPLLESETFYEQQAAEVDDALIRKAAYRAIQAGSFGFTYGAQGIWNAAWDEKDVKDDSTGFVHHNWSEAIDFPGATEMTYLEDFYTAIPWQKLEPRPTDWVVWQQNLSDENMPIVKADASADNVVIYFPKGYNSAGTLGTLSHLQNANYKARWFDPAIGFFNAPTQIIPQNGKWKIGPKPNANDWLLLVQREGVTTSSAKPMTGVTSPSLLANFFYLD